MHHPSLNSPVPLNRTNPSRIATSLRSYARRTLWIEVSEDGQSGVHNFSPNLISDFERTLQDTRRYFDSTSRIPPETPDFAVIRSTHPRYFSQGGDLELFLDCIRRRDAKSLREYSRSCLDVLLAWTNDFKPLMTTISLVQGRALGGGFEMALSSDYIVAEEQSSFGFPEILFGLFPCTGSMGLISARCNPFVAERLMTNKKIYSARELLAMGLIDEVCPEGEGERAVERLIAKRARNRPAQLMVQQHRHRASMIDAMAASQIVEDWVHTAMNLDLADLRQLEMLILMQKGETPDTPHRKVA